MERKPRRCAQSKSCTCPRVTTPIRITRNETQSTSRLPDCRAKTRIWTRLGIETLPPSDVTHVFPSPGLTATLSPSDGERDRVRGLRKSCRPDRVVVPSFAYSTLFFPARVCGG